MLVNSLYSHRIYVAMTTLDEKSTKFFQNDTIFLVIGLLEDKTFFCYEGVTGL